MKVYTVQLRNLYTPLQSRALFVATFIKKIINKIIFPFLFLQRVEQQMTDYTSSNLVEDRVDFH
jgi:hypothetical protein